MAEDALAFQVKLWELLEKRVRLYTSGESSSVPASTAHEMLISILFILGIDPEEIDQGELERLASVDLEGEFEQRLRVLQEKTREVGEVWKTVVLDTPLLESIALKDTLHSLKEFEAQYDPRYFAHEIPGDIDYPLFDPVPERYRGVEYVYEYLCRLRLENDFINRFDIVSCKSLLRRVSPDYRALIINLYEPVATNAIGLALVDGPVRSLQVSDTDRCKIVELFEDVPAKKARQLLLGAADRVCKNLKIEDDRARAYLEKLAGDLYPRIKALAPRGGLSGVFLSFR